MTREERNGWLYVAIVNALTLAFGLLLLLVAGCGGGDVCDRADPCFPGACCVPTDNGSRVCACETTPAGYLPAIGAHAGNIGAAECTRQRDWWKAQCSAGVRP